MKKKGVIVLIILLLVIAIIAGIILYNSHKTNYVKVDKFSMCKIINTLDEEVDNYETNKLPFTIEVADNTEVTVNGEKYQEGKRLYKVGEYDIKIKNDEKYEEAVVSIKNIEKQEESEYNIYFNLATLPTIFSNMSILKNVEQKGFYWTNRTSTIDTQKLQSYCPNLRMSSYIGELSDLDKEEKAKYVSEEIKEYIKEIIRNDENAHFILHVDDTMYYVEFATFVELGLDENRYDVVLYTDGTLTYDRTYEISQENQYENFTAEQKNYDDILDKVRSNDYEKETTKITEYLYYREFYGVDNYNYNYLLISTLRENTTYIVQYPELIKYEDEDVKKEMEKSNLSTIVATEEFSNFSEQEKEMFFELINLDKEEMDEQYFNQDENAKYLIITGTNPFYGKNKQEKFENLIQQVCDKYQDEYTILYKPHPSALPDEEQEAYLNSMNIKVLPGSIPMEAITYIYPNLMLGGFGSSLYMSVDEGKTLFFFSTDKDSLVEPLNVLYDSLFSTAEFIN